MRRTFLAGALALLALAASAQPSDNRPEILLQDPAMEARAREISRSLRCLVCQNQSIEDSNADLARDLRRIVRERVEAGDSERQVQDFLVARYGDWVLLRPPVKARTILLWAGPGILFAAGALGVALYFRKRRAAPPPGALSSTERARLDRLLDDGSKP